MVRVGRWVLATVLLVAAPSFGQEDPPDRGADEENSGDDLDAREAMRTRIETAITLANLGHEELVRGNLTKAIRLLTEAERLAHSPVIVRYLAQAHRKKGSLETARALLTELLDEPLPKDAPLAFIEARAEARVELTELEDEMPAVRVRLTGPGASRAVVRLDGKTLSTTDLQEELLVDPGPHTLAAQPADCEGVVNDFTVALNDDKQVTLELEAAQETSSPTAIMAAPAPMSLTPFQLGGAVALGIGGAALIAGVGTGVAFLARSQALDDRCPNKVCPVELLDEVGAVEALGTVSLVTLIGAAVAGGGGVFLWALSPDQPDGADTAVRLTPGGIGIEGRF